MSILHIWGWKSVKPRKSFNLSRNSLFSQASQNCLETENWIILLPTIFFFKFWKSVLDLFWRKTEVTFTCTQFFHSMSQVQVTNWTGFVVWLIHVSLWSLWKPTTLFKDSINKSYVPELSIWILLVRGHWQIVSTFHFKLSGINGSWSHPLSQIKPVICQLFVKTFVWFWFNWMHLSV